MSPQEAKRLVGITGHSSPQPETRDIAKELRVNAYVIDAGLSHELLGDAACEIEYLRHEIDRLRAIISRVRHLTAYTDAEWAMSEIREFLEETQ